MPRTSNDTRRFRRRTVRVMVDYNCEDGVHCDYATTLGAGGLFLQTEENLHVGSSMKLRFRVPGGEELHGIEGRVVWTRVLRDGQGAAAPGVGVQFTDAAAAARLARGLEDLD